MIVDAQGRRFRNLRVSLTAACNYACEYCVPNGKRLIAAEDELSADRMIRAVELLVAAAGIEKLRITGGEPLVSPKFDVFLSSVVRQPLRDVSITTNGQLLERKGDLIVESGVKRLNVSLDTLNPIAFSKIARGGDLQTVLRGIEKMLAAGLKLKINMVPMRHANLDQVLPLLDFCLERGIELRYIELMNMGHLKHSADYSRQFVGQAELLSMISARYEFARTHAAYDSTSIRYEIPGAGTFGVIANESEPFCSACTRLRLSSNGFLYGCLSNARRHSIAELLDLPDHLALPRLQGLLVRALGDKQSTTFRGEVTVMKFIGG
ncbi:MAG TPA: radical SAM protein [Pseudomonadales bacterium]|nr:radical SAM protein [Pseudomonadales bacterium]